MKLNWKTMSVIAVIIIIAIIAIVAHYALTRGNNNIGVEPVATTTISEPGIIDPSGAGYVVTPIPVPKEELSLKAPDLASVALKITPKNDYEKIVFKTLTDSVANLKSDAENYDSWLTVGISLKQLEKYESARDVFIYISTLWPQEAVANGNLGSLYHLYLKDFSKSESAYKRAIELDPNQEGWYRGLYELYRYSYKQNTDLWEKTLKEGITKTNSVGLMSVLAGRYAELKLFKESVAVYDGAISEAEKQGNQKLVDSLIALRAAARAEIK